jgi:hypothetical protein
LRFIQTTSNISIFFQELQLSINNIIIIFINQSYEIRFQYFIQLFNSIISFNSSFNFVSIIQKINNIFIKTIQNSLQFSFSHIFTFFKSVLCNKTEKPISEQFHSLIYKFLISLFNFLYFSLLTDDNLSIIFNFLFNFPFIFSSNLQTIIFSKIEHYLNNSSFLPFIESCLKLSFSFYSIFTFKN